MTGSAAGLTAANFEAAAALSEGQEIVVLTMEEFEWLTSGEELASLLMEKQACLIARREIHIVAERPQGALPSPWRFRAQSRELRIAKLIELAADLRGVTNGADALATSLATYRRCLSDFSRSEAAEPYGTAESPITGFDDWSEKNLAAFEALEESLKVFARTCIAHLRSQRASEWDVQHLTLGLDLRTPSNLDAPPDSKLADLVLDYWMEIIQHGPGYENHAAVLCLLGWSLEWLVAIETERWPPPWV